MALTKENELGVLTITDEFFSDLIRWAVRQPACEDELWLTDEPSGRFRRLVPWGQNAPLRSLEVTYSSDGGILLSFDVVVRFGTSIRQVTKAACDAAAGRMEELLGVRPEAITVNIAGIRTTKRTAKRATKVVFRYDQN